MKPYLNLKDLVKRIEGENGLACQRLLEENEERFKTAKGSRHLHQNWEGGYYDHIQEVLNIASLLYENYSILRPLPFSRSDALLILFLHDLEKAWRYEQNGSVNPNLKEKSDKAAFRLNKIKEYAIELSPYQLEALKYVEGEMDDYSNKKRVMNELAAFCHVCDITSARLWYDQPRKGDSWSGL